MSLMLHCGGAVVTRDDVFNVTTPEATKTHFPVPHSRLLEAIEMVLQTESGYQITKTTHALSHEGQRYFGVLEVQAPGGGYDDRTLLVGCRNSHDRSFAIDFTLGNRVFVCDNLSFSGEVKLGEERSANRYIPTNTRRKHTRHAINDLPRLVSATVGKLGDHRQKQDLRINAYKAAEINDKDTHDLVIKAVECKAIPGQQIMAVLEQWRKPAHEEFSPRTMWSLFNGFTHVYKEGSLELTRKRSQSLHGLFDSYIGLAV